MTTFARIVLVLLTFTLAPMAQISMDRPGFTPVPPPKRVAAPAKTPPAAVSLTPGEQKHLAAIMKKMPARQRRQLNNTIKRMTPQQRQQFLALLKQQLKAPATKR